MKTTINIASVASASAAGTAVFSGNGKIGVEDQFDAAKAIAGVESFADSAMFGSAGI